MSTPRYCPCGRPAGRRRCPECGRRPPRRFGPREGVLAALAVVAVAAAATCGALVARARSRPAEPIAAPEVAAVRPATPVPLAEAPAPRPAVPPVVAAPLAEPLPTPASTPVVPPPANPPVALPVAPGGVLDRVPAGRYRVGETIDQEVTVARRSAFRVLGAGAPQVSEYTFTSRLTVEAVGRDGGMTVKQRVEATRLGACDPTMRAVLADALTKAKGATFTLTVGPGGEVTGLKGPPDPVRVQEGNDPLGGPTLRVWSLLDDDGWKELAGLTFFQPDRPLAAGEKWARPLAHSWGPLGGWYGRTVYAAAGKRDGAERIDYAHEMTYRPPMAGAAAALPVRVTKAEFRPVAAGGAIRYDAARGRVTAADETFHVRGALAVSAGGVEATVEMEEAQGFRLRILDPAGRALEARPAPR